MHFGPIISVLAISLAAASCASGPAQRPHAIAWDGLGRDPNLIFVQKRALRPVAVKQRKDPNNERERVLTTLRPYSEAWWVVHDELEAENDRVLTSKLMICKGCITFPDAMGSIPR